MAKLSYPEYVLKDSILCKETLDSQYRYLLKIPFTKKPNNSLLVILKNPSTASATDADVTALRVTNYAQRHGFDQVIICNLFAYRCTDSSELKKVINNKKDIIGDLNDGYIQTAARESNKIIIAWGTPPNGLKRLYDQRINEILKGLHVESKPLYFVERLSNKGMYPLHGQVLGYNMKMNSIEKVEELYCDFSEYLQNRHLFKRVQKK